MSPEKFTALPEARCPYESFRATFLVREDRREIIARGKTAVKTRFSETLPL